MKRRMIQKCEQILLKSCECELEELLKYQQEGAEEGFENTMNSKDLKDQTMKSFFLSLRTKLKFLCI